MSHLRRRRTSMYFFTYFRVYNYCFMCHCGGIHAGIEPSARIYRPSFRENKPKTLVFSHTKRAFWACFRENWVYNFGYRSVATLVLAVNRSNHSARSYPHTMYNWSKFRKMRYPIWSVKTSLCQKRYWYTVWLISRERSVQSIPTKYSFPFWQCATHPKQVNI